MPIRTAKTVQTRTTAQPETSSRPLLPMTRTLLSPHPPGTKLRLLLTSPSWMSFLSMTVTMCSRLSSAFLFSGQILDSSMRISGVGLRPCCLIWTRPRFGLLQSNWMIWTNIPGLLCYAEVFQSHCVKCFSKLFQMVFMLGKQFENVKSLKMSRLKMLHLCYKII